ncbi:putative ribonuclease H-like domain-containing protein [Tanacetum coccineum]
MCTYLKNMEGYKLKDLKLKEFDSIQEMFDRAFKRLIDESQVLLRFPRKNNMYSVDLRNIVPKEGLTLLFAKATSDESKLWHKRLGHLNFKTMNKLVKRNLVRGLPSKLFENDQTCVACQKEKQHKASYHLGKFDGKADEVFFIGYSLNSKAFRVFNSRTRIVKENLHIRFSKSTPNAVASTQSNGFVGTKASNNAGQARKETEPIQELSSECNNQEKEDNVNSTNNVNVASTNEVNVVGVIKNNTNEVNVVGGKTSIKLPFDLNMHSLEDYNIFDFSSDDEDDGTVVDMNNLVTTIQVSPILTTRIHKDHPLNQVIGDLQSATQTIKMSKNLEEYGFVSTIQQRINHKDLQNYLFACFLSQEEPKKVIHALKDPSWIETMQEELLQFKLQEVWTLVDLPNGKRSIGSKWIFRNKKDKRGIVIRNKARLVAQGYKQEEEINYDEVFAPVARIEAIRLFLAYASFKDFLVYQMDVKSAFLYRKIEEEVYVCQPPGFEDPDFPDRVYKVEKALYGLHQALRAWYETLSTYLLDNGFQRGKIDKTLFIKRYKGDILLVQVYVDDIIFGSIKKELCIAFEKLMH